jgi:hypothetical protein
VSIHAQQQVDNGRQVRVGLEGQPPGSRHWASCLIIIMRHDEEFGEGDIPPHHPVRILEVGITDSLANRVRGALVGRQEGAAVYLIRCQRIDPPLQLLYNLLDCHCWFANATTVHVASLP